VTDKGKGKTGKAEYTDAEITAQDMSRDPGVKVQHGPRDGRVVPHARDRNGTPPIRKEKLVCPQCGKSTLLAEFPDQFEAWVKCSSCGFFMGMSNEEWHRIKNSPGINEKIKKIAKKRGS